MLCSSSAMNATDQDEDEAPQSLRKTRRKRITGPLGFKVLLQCACCWACTWRPDRGEAWSHVHGVLLVPSPLLSFVPKMFQVARVLPSADQVTIEATPRPIVADCPSCGVASDRIHSVYKRVLHDLPWQGHPVTIRVTARRFRCPNGLCSRQTFAERLIGVMALSSRRTGRRGDLQRHVALALGGEAGARLAARLAIPTSPDTHCFV